jgi:Protein of unknown function (DUF2971)
LPDYLYKYISFGKQKFIEDILKFSRLYFSLPNEFEGTDALDSKTYNIVIKNKEDRRQCIKAEIDAKYSYLSRDQKREMLRVNVRDHKNPDSAFFKERINSLNRIFKESVNDRRVCIFCATNSPDRIEMWKHYIPDGQGVCIKLNIETIIEQLNSLQVSSSPISPHLILLHPVNYVSSPIDVSFSTLKNADQLEVGITLLYTKMSCFEFEQEWRLSIYDCINQSISFPQQFIEEVIVGPNTTNEQMKIITEWNDYRSNPFMISRYNNNYKDIQAA